MNIDKNANYWKVEAREMGYIKASNMDHLRPDPQTAIFLMEVRGEL